MARKFNFSQKETIVAKPPEEKPDAQQEKGDPHQEAKPEESKGRVGTLINKLESDIPNAFQFKFIPRNKLSFFEENDYPQEEIESLAEKILHFGLIHNLEVFFILEEDRYIIDSGERRCHALDLLIEKYKDSADKEDPDYKDYEKNVKMFENGYPCKIKYSIGNAELDSIDLKIRHYIANEEVRNKDKDPQKTAERIQSLNKLYILRNEISSDSSEKISNINKKIAADLGISDRQVKNYKAIDKLIPELRKLFNERKITLADGSHYAQLSEDEQRQLLVLIENGEDKKKISELYENIKSLKKSINDKENEIENLEAEKAEAEKKAVELEHTIGLLQDELAKESEKPEPDAELIDELRAEISAKESHLKSQEKEYDTIVREKDAAIAKLRSELAQTKNAQKDGTIPTGYQELLILNMNIENLKKQFEQLASSYQDYKAAFSEEEPIGKSPEDFQKEIKALIKKAKIFDEK